jgi:hypothetical protein
MSKPGIEREDFMGAEIDQLYAYQIESNKIVISFLMPRVC